MIFSLLEASCLTLALVIVNIFFKRNHNPIVYIAVFFFILSMNFMFPCHAHVKNKNYLIHKFIEKKCLTPQQRNNYQEKIHFHKIEAERTLKDAKERCWWLPDLNDRKLARYCYTTAVFGAMPGSAQSRVVSMLSSMLVQYGLDCMDEWDYINNKLYWSKYHFEMVEWFEHVLKNG